MASINPKSIDELRALESAGSPNFLAEIIDLFLREAAGLVEKLRAAVESRDAALFERSAHTLKGSCGNLGAQAMSRLCAELQAVGHAADWPRAAILLPDLEKEFAQVRAELEAEKGKGLRG